jgi:hypothetical protein
MPVIFRFIDFTSFVEALESESVRRRLATRMTVNRRFEHQV